MHGLRIAGVPPLRGVQSPEVGGDEPFSIAHFAAAPPAFASS